MQRLMKWSFPCSLLHHVCQELAEWYFQDGCSVLAACCHLAVDNVQVHFLLSRHFLSCLNRFLSWPEVVSNCDDNFRVACHFLAGHVGSDTREWAGAGRLRGPCPREGSQSEHRLLPWTFGQEVHDYTNLVRIEVLPILMTSMFTLLYLFPLIKVHFVEIWPEFFSYCQKAQDCPYKYIQVSHHTPCGPIVRKASLKKCHSLDLFNRKI